MEGPYGAQHAAHRRGKRRNGRVARKPRRAVLPVHTSTVFACPVAIAAAAWPSITAGRRCRDQRRAIARLQAQVFAQHRAQHEIRLGERVCGEEPVDFTHPETGIVERTACGLRVQAQAGHGTLPMSDSPTPTIAALLRKSSTANCLLSRA